MRELPDVRAKINWMQQFDGIGEKYARNIWMDIRAPAFVDSIAVDSRLMSVGLILGMDSHVYKEQEAFFLEMASEAGISGWEADRLIYNFREELLAEAGIEIPWKAKRAKRAFRSACSG
jgi:hypothetical protein